MATIYSKKDTNSICRALVQQYNRLHEATVADDGYVHSDITGVVSSNDWERPDSVSLQVSAPDATNLATSIALTKDLRGVMRMHLRDDCAHRKADATGLAILDGYTSAVPADLDEVQDQLNMMQHVWNAHLDRSEGGVVIHLNEDTTNVSTSAEATDQTSSNNLANELKDDLDAHILLGPEVGKIKLV